MSDAARRNRILQRSNDVLLTDQIAKRLATVFSVQGLMGHNCLEIVPPEVYKLWTPFRKYREGCVAQRTDLSLLPSGPGEVHQPAAAQFPAS